MGMGWAWTPSVLAIHQIKRLRIRVNASVYIGTSGWNYRHWRNRFYPEGLRQADWLSHFAGRFDSVEINNAFYRIPDVETIETWQRKTPSRFRFAVKMWRGVSHYTT
jgi:uncharacterized protein YecE (DUF72 family)